LRGTKRTLFEGGLRGVGLISGAGISRRGDVLHGLVAVQDFVPSILEGLLGQEKQRFDPPLESGDGVNVWDYLSGASATSARTELVHEAHPLGSTEGNGNALRVGDWKIVVRTGNMWAHSSNLGTNDGWFGGPGTSDPGNGKWNGAYSLPTGTTSQPWTVQCPPPPKSLTQGYACEKPGSRDGLNDERGPAGETYLEELARRRHRRHGGGHGGGHGGHKTDPGRDSKTYACLFNIADDPCEHTDLSASNPEKLDELWTRLAHYRATAISSTVNASPDGENCPTGATCSAANCNGMKANMLPCSVDDNE